VRLGKKRVGRGEEELRRSLLEIRLSLEWQRGRGRGTVVLYKTTPMEGHH